MAPGPTIQDLIREIQQDALSPDALDRLATASALTQEVSEVADAALGYFVDQARRSGHSWAEIGVALGVSKQAAQQRHIRVGGSIVGTLDRFTERAWRVVAAGEFGARDLGHGYIGTEHLLLAQFAEPEGISARILEGASLSAASVRAAIIDAVGSGPGAPAGDLPYTPRAAQVFSAALSWALELGHNYIGTEHLLLGLAGGDGLAASILSQGGLDTTRVLSLVQDMLAGARRPTKAASKRKPSAPRTG